MRAALGSGEPLAELRRVLTEDSDRGTAASELLAHLERMRTEQEEATATRRAWSHDGTASAPGWAFPTARR